MALRFGDIPYNLPNPTTSSMFLRIGRGTDCQIYAFSMNEESGQGQAVSLRVTIEVNIIDPDALRDSAISRASDTQEVEYAISDPMNALIIASDPIQAADVLAGVEGVEPRAFRVSAETGNPADDDDIHAADTAIVIDGEFADRRPADVPDAPVTEQDFIDLSAQVEGLSPDMLGYDDELEDEGERRRSLRQAKLVAGLLWHASVVMMDELFSDIELLRSRGTPTAADMDETFVISGLPPRFAHRYTALFAQRFLTVAVDLTTRIAGRWQPPSCVAQELALRCLLNEAQLLAEEAGLELDEDWRATVEEFLLEDTDAELLYSEALDGFEDYLDSIGTGVASMKFENWFEPFNNARHVPPYALSD